MNFLVEVVLSASVGYVVGAIPTGVLVARVRGVDLTQTGSGRTGATNTLRALGPVAAAVVFGGDFAKGLVAVLMARALSDGGPWPQVAAAAAAVLGHSCSVFIGWRGGRGVVTGMGGLVGIWPQVALVGILFGAVAIAATRYVSLGSITGTVVSGLVVIGLVIFAGQPSAYLFYGLVVPLIILVAHRDNIERLMRGTERKLGSAQ